MSISKLLKMATIGNLTFVVLTIIATLLITVSFFIPPAGVIDSSVLAACGELFAFSALAAFMQAIATGKKASVRHGETELTIKDEEDETDIEENC